MKGSAEQGIGEAADGRQIEKRLSFGHGLSAIGAELFFFAGIWYLYLPLLGKSQSPAQLSAGGKVRMEPLLSAALNIVKGTGKEKGDCRVQNDLHNVRDILPRAIMRILLRVAEKAGVELYLVGGTVRDWLLRRAVGDIDIAACCSAADLANLLRAELGGGAIIDLSGPEDEAARVVWRHQQVDFATFRSGSRIVEKDLVLRDFTINAMALPLAPLLAGGEPAVIDPTGGLIDLQAKRIRLCPGAFAADPLRMLRGYRLAAVLGFQIDTPTRAEVRRYAPRINAAAMERIGYELQRIFASSRTAPTLQCMHEDGLLEWLFPELYQGAGVLQPEFHHLDVFEHSFLTCRLMEEILAQPQRWFPQCNEEIDAYLRLENTAACLKWAALLHDIGKPATREQQPGNDGRVTFYRHDEVGMDLFREFAERNRWSRADTNRVGGLIAMHMHPFHLCNVGREGKITRRAALKLCRRAGKDLPGLFLLAMADSLAGCGEKKPQRMEEELRELYAFVQKIYDEYIAPVLCGPRLLTGSDLINEFDLQPGPLFSTLLNELEMARVEGEVQDKPAALDFISARLRDLTAVSPSGLEADGEQVFALSKNNKWTKTCVK